LTENPEAAASTMRALSAAGVSMERVTERLLDEGVALFVDAFDSLVTAIERRRCQAVAPR